MRRLAPVTLVTIGLLALLGWYVIYTRGVVRELRQEASRVGLMYARVYHGLNDPSEDAANTALFDLSNHIRESGVPIIVTDAEGNPTAQANLPFGPSPTRRQMRSYIPELDRQNAPVVEPGVGTVHYGNTPLVRGLILIPLLQSILIGMILLAGAYALRTRGRADREQIWAGMARESAHQLGTPLSSISGWIELLRESEPEPMTAAALDHMDADRARVPTLAQRVTVSSSHQEELVIQGDEVLLEWALESLAKNAIDALAGRDGRVEISAAALPEGRVRVRVADDGPGVPREIRNQIFEPGFSTKEKGWGIGLSLARRIVRDSHGGELLLVQTERGATFDMVLG